MAVFMNKKFIDIAEQIKGHIVDPSIFAPRGILNGNGLWLPQIGKASIPLGPYTLEVAGYCVPGGGKPDLLSNEDYIAVRQLSPNHIVLIVADGLTGVSSKQVRLSGLSGGHWASHSLSENIINKLKARISADTDISVDVIIESIMSANRELALVNEMYNLKMPATQAATMLALAVISADGKAWLVQVGDAQLMLPNRREVWWGDQEKLGEIQRWMICNTTVKLHRAFYEQQFNLLMNQRNSASSETIAKIMQWLDSYNIPLARFGLTQRNVMSKLAFAALNGDPRARQFIRVKQIQLEPGEPLALFTDGISDGVNNWTWLADTLRPSDQEQALRVISSRTIINVNKGKTSALKPLGDDQGIVIARYH